MASYSLGSSDPEITRLDAQAAFLRRPTQILLEAAGLAPGMRVLDLGTGLGHVALAVADIVGPTGEVVGIDVDPRMLEVARARAEALPHVHFVEADATSWTSDETYDAVVGRLILFHLADPVAVVRHHLRSVRPGGTALVIDYDMAGMRTEPRDDLTEQMVELLRGGFRAAGADPVIGARLQDVLKEAGAGEVTGFGITDYLGPSDPRGPMLLGAVMRSLAPAIVAHGLATESQLDLETLPARTAASLASRGSVLVPPALVGAWGTRP